MVVNGRLLPFFGSNPRRHRHATFQIALARVRRGVRGVDRAWRGGRDAPKRGGARRGTERPVRRIPMRSKPLSLCLLTVCLCLVCVFVFGPTLQVVAEEPRVALEIGYGDSEAGPLCVRACLIACNLIPNPIARAACRRGCFALCRTIPW